MTLTTTETQFLHIAKAAISGGDLPAEKVDWPAIFTLANQQKLLPILFEAVRKMPAAEENVALFAVTKQQVIGQVLNQTVRSAEFADLYRKLRAAGLEMPPLSGFYVGAPDAAALGRVVVNYAALEPEQFTAALRAALPTLRDAKS